MTTEILLGILTGVFMLLAYASGYFSGYIRARDWLCDYIKRKYGEDVPKDE